MKSLEERIADRKARGKALAEQNADGKPTKEQIEAATSKTFLAPAEGTKTAGGNKAVDWKPNA